MEHIQSANNPSYKLIGIEIRQMTYTSKAKKIFLSVVAVMAMTIGAMWLSTTEADAASVSISGVPSSVTKGQSFTVTVTYSGDTWGVAVGYFTCSSNLSIVSGSSYSIYNSSGVSSLSASATVTATGTGSGSVTAHTTSASNYDMVDVFPGSASGYVTVSEPAKSSSSSSSSSSSKSSSSSSNKSNNKSTSKSTSKKSTKTEKSDDPQAEKEAKKEEAAQEEAKETAKETPIEVEVNGVKYTVVESKKNIPEGFSTATFKYGDKEIQGIRSEDKKYAMVKLTPSDGSGKATWFFFDEETGTFTDSATLSPSDIIAMYEPEESETPLVWVVMTIVLGSLVIILSALMYKMKK